MALTPEQMGGLWGDGGPYSQVHVIREVRILDDGLGRTFYYVKANVNPTTYATLKAMENRITDEAIRAFLQNATFVSDEEGYEWHVYGQSGTSPRGANRVAVQVADAIIRMHRLVMECWKLSPAHPGRAPGPPGEPAHPGADS